MPSRNSHLTVEEIAGLIDGRLTKNSTQSALDHVLGCSDCAEEYFLGLELRDREQAGLHGEGHSQVAQKFLTLIRANHEGDTRSAGKTSLLAGLVGLASGISRRGPEPALAAHSSVFAENDDGGVSSDVHPASLEPEHTNASSRTGGTHMPITTSTFVDAPKIVGDSSTSIVSPEVHQQYKDTCAVQCQRLILNDFGVGVTETELRDEAAAHGLYDHGTKAADVGRLLESHGVPVHRYDNANIFNLSNELAQGHKVIVGVDSTDLWHPHSILHEVAEFFGMTGADHAVIVSGIDTTDPDHVRVNITDPGTGHLAKSYPLEQFLDAWKESHFVMVSTAEAAPSTLPEMVNFPFAQGHLDLVGHAPYDLVHGLASSFDDSCGTDAFHAVECQYLAAVHGAPVNMEIIDRLGHFPGQDYVHSLFHSLEPDLYGVGPAIDEVGPDMPHDFASASSSVASPLDNHGVTDSFHSDVLHDPLHHDPAHHESDHSDGHDSMPDDSDIDHSHH